MKHRNVFFTFLLIFLFTNVFFTESSEYAVRFKRGDTIYRIAKEHGIPIDTLLLINNIKDPTKVKAGTEIQIPAVYTIKQGDTLQHIAEQYDVTLKSILKFNNISENDKLKPGKKLYLLTDKVIHTPDIDSSSKWDHLIWPHPGTRERLSGKLYGVAILGKPGDNIVSVTNGRVVWAGPYRGYGKMIFIKSKKKYIYIYAGNEKILVKVGDQVQKEIPIGVLGESSHDGQAKALFCMYDGSKSLDPFTTERE
jgi:lipoprotein NlpD